MHIKRIEIGHFGNLKNFALDFKPAANLIVAPNEWGKSTLIDFIFAVFYGMDRNNPQNLRSSNRSRNMPWGQDSMDGALLFEADGRDYRVSCEFGAQPRLDRIILTDENLGETYEISSDEPLGKSLFGLGEQSFNQSVYVQQMSLALNVKDDKKGELLHQLASLGTAGSTEISSTAVAKSLNEAILTLSSPRRKDALIPNLESERSRLLESLDEARARESQEAEDLMELQGLEGEVELLEERVRSSERKLQRTKYLIRLQDLQESVQEEESIREQEKLTQKRLEQVESLKPSVKSTDFVDLDQEIRRLQVEGSTLDNNRKNLTIEQGAVRQSLAQAFNNSHSETDDANEQSVGERQRELRKQAQTLDKELLSVYARQQQKQANLGAAEDELEKTAVPQTEAQEKKFKLLGFALTFLGLSAAVVGGIIFHPAAYALVVIAGIGFYFLWKSGNLSSERVVIDLKRIELESRVKETRSDLEEVDAEVEDLKRQIDLLEEEQLTLEEAESEIRKRQQEAKVREESFLKNLERHQERSANFCDAIDELIAKYPYLNTDAIIDKIMDGQALPQPEELEYSTSGLPSTYAAELLQEESDADKRRYSQAQKLFERFAASYKELSKYVQSLQQYEHQLREQLRVLSSGQGSERLLPSQSRERLLAEAAEKGLPADDKAIALAIEEEIIPDDLSQSLRRREFDLQNNRDKYNQALSAYSEKRAHMSLAYRHKERSENIELRLEEMNEKIARLESRSRQLELAQHYLEEADEEMRRNFSPELRVLTAKYLEKLTLGRYDDVLIDRDMKLQLHLSGETQFREAEYMSGGCYDQVYLALRLALSELITQDETPPLILDDVLVQFDEKRMTAALALLAELSREESEADKLGESRQILLFSCHERVAEMAENVGGFEIKRMSS